MLIVRILYILALFLITEIPFFLLYIFVQILKIIARLLNNTISWMKKKQ